MKQQRTEFHYKARKTKTSQSARLYRYLSSFDKEERDYYLESALKICYLPQALQQEGVRDREDLHQIARECRSKLLAQAQLISELMGLEDVSFNAANTNRVNSSGSVATIEPESDGEPEKGDGQREDDGKLPRISGLVKENEKLVTGYEMSDEEFNQMMDGI